MSNKSGVASQVISLPKSGGALQGIGETFAPDLFTGTGNLTVPIVLPPGRNGFAPELRLTYSTGNGNGPFGLGWTLGVPEMTRKTSHGVPRYRDAAGPGEQDTFLLSGSEDLVPVGSAAGVTRFRPRTEGPFARIERLGDGTWRVGGRDGLVSRFGTALPGAEAAVVADPEDPARVFGWKLTETTDPFGNRIEYAYLRDRGSAGPRVWDQLYPQEIRYVDHEEGGQRRFLVTVRFVYAERPDPFSNHRGGFEVRTRLRCTRIEVRTHADAETLARTYRLVYLDERVRAGEMDAAVLPSNGVSLLSQVLVVGHDGSRTQELPPLEFGYSTFEPRRRLRPVEGTSDTLPRRSLAHEDFELVDLFGNGLPDIVELNGTTRFWRNLGNGRFDAPRTMPEVPAGVHLRDAGTQLADLNGNGRTDLLSLDRGGYFPLSFTGRWSRDGFVRYPAAPSVPLGEGNLRLLDLDGDGVVDALRTGPVFELFRNDPIAGWDEVRTLPRRPLPEFPDVSFADPRVKLADLTGDGLQDIVLVEQGRVDYWPYLGHGRWGRRVTMTGSPVFDDPLLPPGRFDPRRVLVGDVDGDGLDDIVYVEANRVTLWVNQSGNGFAPPVTLNGTLRFPDVDAVRLVDLLGTGIASILWSSDTTEPGTGGYQFADLTGGVKPYLLREMDNHHGARTLISYAASTESYVADAADPATRWATPLPFPVQVVTGVDVVDEVSGGRLSTRFRYHHGYWDGAEREFRGFGMVEQLDTEHLDRPADSPPLLTKTWFHLGPIGEETGRRQEADFSRDYWPEDPPALARPADTERLLTSLPASAAADALRVLRGSVLRTELYALDGTDRHDRPYTVTEAQYGIREEDPPPVGSGRRRVFYPHPAARRTTQWERGAEPMHRFDITDAYDGYGLPGLEATVAVPRGRDFRVAATGQQHPYLGTRTATRYAQRDDERRYVVDRVAQTTTHEIVNDGRAALPDLLDAVRTGTARLAVVHQTRNYYDGEAFAGLPLGTLGDFGVPVRSETLVLTDEILRQAYGGDGEPDRPPYLVPGGPPAWTGEYPHPFRDALPALAGYTHAEADPDRPAGYFVTTSRQRYDVHDAGDGPIHGLPIVRRDPLGRDTTIDYDQFRLLPVRVVDPAGLAIEAAYDYRVLQARLVTDRNGNRTAFTFTPLGLLASTAVMGKAGESAGDTTQVPGARLVYDFARQPISVRAVRRVHHVTETDVPADQLDSTVETVEYSDGFGRLAQIRTQAEDVRFGEPTFGGDVLAAVQGDPATSRAVTGRHNTDRQRPNVIVSGAQVYDNKGRVVEKYEPYQDTGWDFRPPGEAQLGQRARMVYDPRGQVVRTENPDGSEQRVVHGVPGDVADPDRFTPTPWEIYTYDPNDNAGRTHAGEAGGYRHHWNTPTSVTLDPLGRPARSTERHRPAPTSAGDPPPPVEELHSTATHDVRGNLLTVTDPLGRTAYRAVYDLTDRPLRTEGPDAGIRRTVLDAAGNEVERRDAKGALTLRAHDLLSRPARVWARDDATASVTLRERLEYGDGGDLAQPAAERAASRTANRLGELHRHYDEAGLLTLDRCDFKGNVVAKTRRLIADEAIVAVFPAADDPVPDWRVTPFRADWEPPPGTSFADHVAALLEPAGYESTATYDALNRVASMRYPRGVDGGRMLLQPAYNRAGLLERVILDGQVFVDHIAYDAKGQRTLVAYGDGVLTRYAYDPRSFRLRRLRTERYTRPAAAIYQPTGEPLQDIAYEHDLVGNLLGTVDRTPGCGIAANPAAGTIADAELRALVARGDALNRRFTYDSLYRLASATGRACTGGAGSQPWADDPRCGFNSAGHGTPDQDNAPKLTSAYREAYGYDAAGNLTRLRHTAGGAATVREFRLVAGTNRLRSLTTGGTTVAYTHDASGNLTREGETRLFEWDADDRLKAFRTQVGTAEPSVHAQYLYDAAGQRVKKLVRRQGGQVTVTTYIDGVFEHHRWPGGANNDLHVMDDQRRITVVRVGPAHPDDRTPAVRYHLGDHLGSIAVAIGADGGFVNREEFTPYGETTFGGFARKRYRFTGKERDEESGLNHHGARYYAPWLGRWTAPDPAGPVDGPNLYAYVRGKPLVLLDRSGRQAGPYQGVVQVGHLNNAARELKESSVGQAAVWTGRFLDGIARRAVETGEGAYQIVRHPIRTGEALAEVVKHPVRSAKALARGIKKTVEAAATGDPDAVAGVVFEGLSMLVPASKGTKLAKAERLAGEAAEVAVDAARIEKAAAIGLAHAEAEAGKLAKVAASLKVKYPRSLGTLAQSRAVFMRQALKTIVADENHPLRFLVSPGGSKWLARTHLTELPTVQAGHLTSRHSGAVERFAIEDAFFNQVSNWKGETQGAIFHKTAVEIGGVAVEERTAQMWQRLGLIP